LKQYLPDYLLVENLEMFSTTLRELSQSTCGLWFEPICVVDYVVDYTVGRLSVTVA